MIDFTQLILAGIRLYQIVKDLRAKKQGGTFRTKLLVEAPNGETFEFPFVSITV